MRYNKVITFLLVVVLMLIPVQSISAAENSAKVIRANGYTVKVVAQTDVYQKLEIVNYDTGKIEVLEALKEVIGNIFQQLMVKNITWRVLTITS